MNIVLKTWNLAEKIWNNFITKKKGDKELQKKAWKVVSFRKRAGNCIIVETAAGRYCHLKKKKKKKKKKMVMLFTILLETMETIHILHGSVVSICEPFCASM